MRITRVVSVLLVVILLLSAPAVASIFDDPFGMAGYKGTVGILEYNEEFAIRVEYCVWAPGQFDASFSGQAGIPTIKAGHYVYGYQLFNDASVGGATDGYVTRFSVGLMLEMNPGGDGIMDIGSSHDPDDSATHSPSGDGLITKTAFWSFSDPDELFYGTISDVLYFTTPISPVLELRASATGKGMGNIIPAEVPVPSQAVPEL